MRASPRQEHTPGLLSTRPEDLLIHPDPTQRAQCIRDAGLQIIATVLPDVREPHLAAADARRLVACWNACVGIPTEELEAGLIGDALSALEAVRRDAGDGGPTSDYVSTITASAVASALARAKGGA